MAVKYYEINGIGQVRVQKRRGAKSMRLKISQDGTVTVGIPYWVPFNAAIEFAKKQNEWIEKHRPEQKTIKIGQKIGRNHVVNLIRKENKNPTVKVTETDINVIYPHDHPEDQKLFQTLATKGAKRALIKQEYILESALRHYANKNSYSYNSMSCKFMKSKWGSCNNLRHITLNYRLLDLPDHLVEYVIVHELVHLNHMNHSADYWRELSTLLPDFKNRKLELKKIQLAW
jgi:predicted metal-dependent hydrolase